MGATEYIVIGLDESGEFHNTPYPDGKYNDPLKILGIIYRKVQEPMSIEFYDIQIDNKNIVVIEIPKSYNKPHVIKQFRNSQNYIPIRKSKSNLSC
ncbi:hypothetical protein COE36_25170 [Bacillus cereus]|nr:hypothetical protein COJ34_20525 [Bacillus cereus]PFQ99276.1 hypothetical protein COK32_05265 [Bacillus cereus]PGY81757.1 hypothetical protein COE36_25170 [Bacillus cereus]